jgi:hypothetical protein
MQGRSEAETLHLPFYISAPDTLHVWVSVKRHYSITLSPVLHGKAGAGADPPLAT